MDKPAVPEGPTVQELQARITQLDAENVAESRSRNKAQMERDKLSKFSEIKNEELSRCRAEVLNKHRDMEELEEKHRTHLQVLNQKTRHMAYEQQSLLSALKADNEVALKVQLEQSLTREHELLEEQRALKAKIREVELGYEGAMKQMKIDHAKEITWMRQDFDTKSKDLLQINDKKVKKVEAESDLRRKQEIHEIEERKNSHIKELMKKHEKAFADIKYYYNDITQNNLDLIKTLKEDIVDMKKKEQANEKFMYEIAQENKHSMEPLTKALKEVETLRKQVQILEKDRMALLQLREQNGSNIKHMKHLEWEFRTLQEKMDKVQSDRDDLYARFESCIFDVQQKCGLKSMLLEKKVQVLDEELEKKEAEIGLLTAGRTNPAGPDVEKLIETKNQQIKCLYYELGKVSKAHDAVVRAYECKLAELGVPLQEMGLPHYLTRMKL